MMLRKTPLRQTGLERHLLASMRPQHDAAENGLPELELSTIEAASMRPQHDAAENLKRSGCVCERNTGFNEAAA